MSARRWLPAATARFWSGGPGSGDRLPAELELDADQAVAQLYAVHYQPLIRLAAMLVRDVAAAEEVVQDAFVAIHDAWPRLGDAEKALAYLRQAVLNRSRSVLGQPTIAEQNLPETPETPGAEDTVLDLPEPDATLAALGGLPALQREAILLRYYADLSEAEIAATMGISRGAVKAHTARGMAALRDAFEQATSPPDRPEDSGPGPRA